MFKYIFKRLLYLIPTGFLISLFSFFLSVKSPGDAVSMLLGPENAIQEDNPNYILKRKELKLDLPLFYFSINSWAEPKFFPPYWTNKQIQLANRILNQTGNYDLTKNYIDLVFQSNDPFLKDECNFNEIEKYLMEKQNTKIKLVFDQLKFNSTKWKLYFPKFFFYGFDNQYHNWVSNFVTFNFGVSYIDQKPIIEKIFEALKWSFVLGFVSVIFSFVISIVLGIYLAQNSGSKLEKLISNILILSNSFPEFWIATLLIVFLCNPEFLALFPAGGTQSIMNSNNWPLYSRILDWIYHLILPIFCYSYGIIAFLSLLLKQNLLENINKDYVRTAKSKGLSENAVFYKHLLPNSLFPLITQFSSFLSIIVTGSILIESIFSIPGMGSLLFFSISNKDYPLIITIFTLSGFVTLFGVLISDILYAYFDRRVLENTIG